MSYEEEQAELSRLMEECLNEDTENLSAVEYDGSDDEGEVDELEISDLNTDTEQETSDSEDVNVIYGPTFTGKDGTEWAKHVPNQKVRTRAENLMKPLPGVKEPVKELKFEISCIS